MENMTLFGLETEPKTKKIRIRSIRAIFSNEVIRENAPVWVESTCTSAENVFELFRDLAQEAKENFVALHLDAKNRIICFDKVSIGSLNASIVHPREVYKTALLSSAAAVLFIHNHPSGDTAPSREDIEI
jgi:DNA repair protein RadC